MPQQNKVRGADALLGLLVVASAGALIWDAKTEHKVQPRTEWPDPLGTLVASLERITRWKTNIRAIFDAAGARSLG